MNIRTNLIVILALFTLFSFSVYGQTKVVQNERDTSRQWEIGLDMLWLIDKNSLPPTSLFARYNFIKKNNKSAAWRLRVGVDVSHYDSSQIRNLAPHDIKNTLIFIQPGYEWQIIKKRYVFFYGLDAKAGYSKHDFDNTVLMQGGVWTRFYGEDKTFEYGLSPFFGFKYNFNNWLSISAESSITMMYKVRRQNSEAIEVDTQLPAGSGAVNVDNFIVRANSISVVNLCFKF